jgi:secreted PhoX family phosphatase
MHAIFEPYDPMYKGDETTGLAFSPDGKTMFANFQDCGCSVPYADDCGCLFQFIRDDGMSFDMMKNSSFYECFAKNLSGML